MSTLSCGCEYDGGERLVKACLLHAWPGQFIEYVKRSCCAEARADERAQLRQKLHELDVMYEGFAREQHRVMDLEGHRESMAVLHVLRDLDAWLDARPRGLGEW